MEMNLRVDDIGFGGLKLIQDPQEFCYGVDAVILADFTYTMCPQFNKCVDLGTGNGIIPFILSYKNKKSNFVGIDIQEKAIFRARKSCELNLLENRIEFLKGDVAEIDAVGIKKCSIDVVTCNPPYVEKNAGGTNENKGKYIARHETSANLEDFIKGAAYMLKAGGSLFMIHRPQRLVDIFCFGRHHKLEPKIIRPVAPRKNEAPNLVLVQCKKNGGRELRILPTMNVYEDGQKYSQEIEEIYERNN